MSEHPQRPYIFLIIFRNESSLMSLAGFIATHISTAVAVKTELTSTKEFLA